MKKKLSLKFLFVCALLLSASLVNNVSAQTDKTCETAKPIYKSAPAISADVVISEVYGGSETGGVYNADFIELYNNSAAAVNISAFAIQYYTAGQINGGAPTSIAGIPDGTILAAFSYYVIRVSPDNRAGAPLPCISLNASATFAETGIDSSGGKVVLTNTTAALPDCTSTLNVVDRLGYGLTPVVCNEYANAAQPTSATSVQRLAGASDTDNNSQDFISSQAPTPCGQLLTPTAAFVDVGGRVTNAKGRGIMNALIRMTDSTGVVHREYTNSFGFYSFSAVEVGQTVFVDVISKRYNFVEPLKVVSLLEESANVDFIAY
ncbi:MAG: putative large secreted protein [Acidobacteria bacterium]|jgi:hypothetical protein|nr:putative large secreted protein [Acidobacteriota bacterium]